MSINAVIYARYSSDNQREESIDGQLRECKAFAKKQGMLLVETYIDRALSAKTDDRPDFQRMIKESEKGLFDVVIVWKLDRFSRDRYDSAHYKRVLSKNGVKVVSATEPISNDASGILLESLLEGMAEYYSAELSEKINRGMSENVINGKYNGQVVPIGYWIDEDRHYQIDKTTAPIIREMFDMYANGKTLKEVTQFLNEKGIRTKQGNPYVVNSVTKILHNRKYIGEYWHGEMVNKKAIPPIVSKTIFNKVQARFEKNKRTPARRMTHDDYYYLTTKLICGDCDVFMSGESGTGRSGKIHRYYKCANAKRRRGCGRKAIGKEWIENLVITWIKELLLDNETIEELVTMLLDAQDKSDVTIPVLKKDLADIEKKIENMIIAIESGVLTPTTKERLETLEKRKEDLVVSIATEEIRRVYIPGDLIRKLILDFRNYDLGEHEQKQRLIDTFVSAIYVFDDRLVCTFNFREGAKTVTIKELGGSTLLDEAPPT
jgi:Site-specific recombinases, DNA invertase Pin homologs